MGVRGKPIFTNCRFLEHYLPSSRLAIHLLLCFVLVALATTFAGFYGQSHAPGDLIWIANGMLLAYMLLARRRHWPAYLLTGFLALVFGDILIHESWRMSLMFSALNIVEVLIATLLMRRQTVEVPRFTNLAYLSRFIGFAVLTAPITVGLAFAFIISPWTYTSLLHAFWGWAGPDCLGIAVITPTCVAIFQSDFSDRRWWRTDCIYLALSAAVAIGSFCQDSIPISLLIYPLLVITALRVDLGCATLSMLLIAITGSFYTAYGLGPFATKDPGNSIEAYVYLQLHVIVGIFMLYSISVFRDRQKDTERQLREVVALHKLVTENSRDAIVLIYFGKHENYVSAAAENLTGWSRKELLAMRGLNLLYTKDRAKAMAVMNSLRSGVEGAVAEVRIRRRGGGYRWVEANLRLVRDPETGIPTGILKVIRDISERKRAEQKLHEAYSTVEALAITDGLTGLANRRRFDKCLASEWRRGMRDGQSLSLLMIDADYFKLYNDTYGHMRGDSCLRQIAESCQDVVARPGDLVARFGGEEFAIILPNTSNEGAIQVANEVCLALRSRKLQHRANLPGIVTISIGCATMIPAMGKHATDLIEMADQALYRAKHYGRNQVCNGNATENSEKETQLSVL